MASSSESDVGYSRHTRSRSRRQLPSPPFKASKRPMAEKVNKLASTLKDTNRNLKAVDMMMEDYRDLDQQKTSAIDRLRGELARTTDKLKTERLRASAGASRNTTRLRASDLDDDVLDERRSHLRRSPTSPLRDYARSASDYEYTGFPERRRSLRSRKPSVRFMEEQADGDHLHELHQSIRDLTSDQSRLGEELNKEIHRRNRDDIRTDRTLRELSESLRRPPAESVSESVDKKLQSIQDELLKGRRKLERKHSDIENLSTDLRQALSHQHTLQQLHSQPLVPPPVTPSREDVHVRSKLAHAESEKNKLELEIDNVQRRLDQSEGGRTALAGQMDELRTHLARSEQEKSLLRSHLEQQLTAEDRRERKRRKAAEDDQDREKDRLKEEIDSLRTQLTHASGIGELDDARRALDKSERQRTQLSDHIEVLTKDLENKEKQAAKIISQLRDVSDRCDDSEKGKHKTLVQLEEALKRLRDVSRDSEESNNNLKETQDQLRESERKRNEIKTKAQETIRQWKSKCKTLERDVDRHEHSCNQLAERNEQLVKECEQMRSQTSIGGNQLNILKREIEDILSVRAQQDEMLRQRDVEVSELRGSNRELEQQSREAKQIMDRMEAELHSLQSKYNALSDEKLKLQDLLSQSENGRHLSEDHKHQLEREVRELNSHKAEMLGQLSQEASQKKDLKRCLAECTHKEAMVRDELNIVNKQLQEEKESHMYAVERVKRDLEEVKQKENRSSQEMSKKIKQNQSEYENELQALRSQLAEDKSHIKVMKRNNEKNKAEMERLHEDLVRQEEEMEKQKRKYQKLKLEYDSRGHFAQEDANRVKQLEEQLLSAKDSIRKLDIDQKSLVTSIGSDIEALVEIASLDCIDKYQALSPRKSSSNSLQYWQADVRSKLQWLRSEIQEHRDQKKKLKAELRQCIKASDSDRKFFESEIDKQKNLLDELLVQRRDAARKETEKMEQVAELKEHVLDLTDHLDVTEAELEKVKSEDQEKQNILDEIKELRESDRERQKIHDRYNRLQETMSSLRLELTDGSRSKSEKRPNMKNSVSNKMQAECKKRHGSSPPTHDYSDLPPSSKYSRQTEIKTIKRGETTKKSPMDRYYGVFDSHETSDKRNHSQNYDSSNSSVSSQISADRYESRSYYDHKTTTGNEAIPTDTYRSRNLFGQYSPPLGEISPNTLQSSPKTLEIPGIIKPKKNVSFVDDIDVTLSPFDFRYEPKRMKTSENNKTPPPLMLSDEDFRNKFVPKTPRFASGSLGFT